MHLRFDRNRTAIILVLTFVSFLLFAPNHKAQNHPKRIRGYKVHNAKVSVVSEKHQAAEKSIVVVAKFETPTPSSVSVSRLSLALKGHIQVFEQSGKIDFIQFEKFTINGVNVEVAEYRSSFPFKKNKPRPLPDSIKISVGTLQALRGTFRELISGGDFWRVRGKVLVFGKFKKAFFNFKRVIPIEVDLYVPKPDLKDVAPF